MVKKDTSNFHLDSNVNWMLVHEENCTQFGLEMEEEHGRWVREQVVSQFQRRAWEARLRRRRGASQAPVLVNQ